MASRYVGSPRDRASDTSRRRTVPAAYAAGWPGCRPQGALLVGGVERFPRLTPRAGPGVAPFGSLERAAISFDSSEIATLSLMNRDRHALPDESGSLAMTNAPDSTIGAQQAAQRRHLRSPRRKPWEHDAPLSSSSPAGQRRERSWLSRPFRALFRMAIGTQGVALGCVITARWA
jgi:hypothetical protein